MPAGSSLALSVLAFPHNPVASYKVAVQVAAGVVSALC